MQHKTTKTAPAVAETINNNTITSASSFLFDDEERVPFLPAAGTPAGCVHTNGPVFHNENNHDASAIMREEDVHHNTNSDAGRWWWCGCHVSLGSVANLCSATLGAGVLALPYAFYQAGLVAGTLLLFGAAWSTTASIRLLVQSIATVSTTIHHRSRRQNNDRHDHRNSDSETGIESRSSDTDSDSDHHNDPHILTYEELVEIVLGRRVRMMVEFLIIVCCGGCAVAYIIAIHDILNQVSMLPKYSIYIVWACIMLPLSLLRTMKSLQCSSSIGVAGIITLVLSAIIHLLLLKNTTDNDNNNGSNDNHSTAYAHDYDYYHHNHPKSYYSNSNYNTPNTDSYYYNNHNNNDNALFSSSLQQQHPTNIINVKEFVTSFLYPANGVISILIACPIILFSFFCQVNVAAIFEEIIILEKTKEAERRRSDSNRHHRQQPQQDHLNNTNEENNHSSSGNNSSSTSVRSMENITYTSVTVCTVLYLSVSIVSLMDFGTDITPNLLSCYNPESFMQVAFTAMTLSIIVAFPLNVFPARVSLQGMLFNTASATSTLPVPINNNHAPLTTSSSSSSSSSTRRSVIVEEQHYRLQTQIAHIQTQEEEQEQKTAALAALRAAAFAATTTPFENNNNEEEGVSPMRILEEPLLLPLARNTNNSTGFSSRGNCCGGPPIIQQQQQEEHYNTIVTSSSTPPLLADLPLLIQHVGLTLFITGIALLLAQIVPNISVVFGLLGGTTSSVLGLILPGLISIKLQKLQRRTLTNSNGDDGRGSPSMISAWVLFIGGIIIGIVTTSVTLYNTFI